MLSLSMFDKHSIRFQTPHPVIRWPYHPDFIDGARLARSHVILNDLISSVLSRSKDVAGFSYDSQLHVKAVIGHGLVRNVHGPLTRKGIFLCRSTEATGAANTDSNVLILYLESTTSLQTQLSILERAAAHEMGHFALDKPHFNPRTLADFSLYKSSPHTGFYHHAEFRADAFGAEVLEKESYLESMKSRRGGFISRLLDKTPDDTHPAWTQRIEAIEKGSYREILLDNLAKAKLALDQGKNFDSWADYTANKALYTAVQKQI